MTRLDCRRAVVESVRNLGFAGSEREVPLDVPLTEDGLGLDSLTVVEVFSDLEGRLGVPIFESAWFEGGDLTLASLIGYLESVAEDPAAGDRGGLDRVRGNGRPDDASAD